MKIESITEKDHAIVVKIARIKYCQCKKNLRDIDVADIVDEFYRQKLKLYDPKRGKFKPFVENHIRSIVYELRRKNANKLRMYKEWAEDPTAPRRFNPVNLYDNEEVPPEIYIDDPPDPFYLDSVGSCSYIIMCIDRYIRKGQDSKAIEKLKEIMLGQGYPEVELKKFDLQKVINLRRDSNKRRYNK